MLFSTRGPKSLPLESGCPAVTVVNAGALDAATVGLFVLLCCSSFCDDTLYGAGVLLDREYGDGVTVEG